MRILQQFWHNDDAQDIAEYAIMLAVLLVVTIVTIRAIGENANSLFSKLANMLGSVS
jgi:Flp pilus assembly pilin Flp